MVPAVAGAFRILREDLMFSEQLGRSYAEVSTFLIQTLVNLPGLRRPVTDAY
jgi:hypothetical protein